MATQYLIGEDGAPLPEGIVLAHTVHGQPDHSVNHAWAVTNPDLGAVQPSPDPGMPYIGDAAANGPHEDLPDPRAKRCRAKDDTCMGWRISNSDFCAAHAGLMYNRWERAREQAAAAERES
jgi:hypothetical protein